MCGGHYDVGGNEEGKKVLSVCRRQTRSRYELYESFLASSVDSFCLFNTPRSEASRLLADCGKSVFFTSWFRVCITQQSAFISVAVGLRVVLVSW